MKDSLLKKEFKQKDVQRARNLITKQYSDKTTVGVGYEKKETKHKEGEVWEEDGKKWTIKNGIKRTVSKYKDVKEGVKIPFTCPKCNGSMQHHLAKKMYKIHGFCFNCTIEYESHLRKIGKYKEYEKAMMTGNMGKFVKDLSDYVLETLDAKEEHVTEIGDNENWGSTGTKYKEVVKNKLKEYLEEVKKHQK